MILCDLKLISRSAPNKSNEMNNVQGKLFHLPFGILFNFHLQYTNLTNNVLAHNEQLGADMKANEEIQHLYSSVCSLFCRDFLYLQRGIFSINGY